jgi:hypothetical protein
MHHTENMYFLQDKYRASIIAQEGTRGKNHKNKNKLKIASHQGRTSSTSSLSPRPNKSTGLKKTPPIIGQ